MGIFKKNKKQPEVKHSQEWKEGYNQALTDIKNQMKEQVEETRKGFLEMLDDENFNQIFTEVDLDTLWKK